MLLCKRLHPPPFIVALALPTTDRPYLLQDDALTSPPRLLTNHTGRLWTATICFFGLLLVCGNGLVISTLTRDQPVGPRALAPAAAAAAPAAAVPPLHTHRHYRANALIGRFALLHHGPKGNRMLHDTVTHGLFPHWFEASGTFNESTALNDVLRAVAHIAAREVEETAP